MLVLLFIGQPILYSQGDLIRCYTVEYNEWLKNKYPDIPSDESFEEWMTLTQSKYQNILSKKSKSNAATYTIPVIFHIIHDGESVSNTPNVHYDYIQAQLDQLNLDFSNMSGSDDPTAEDSDIEFVMAEVDESGNLLSELGVNRRDRDEFGFNAPPYSSSYVNNTIKPNTIWDPSCYMNIWVLDLSGGLLGFAQFPSQSGLPGLNTNGGSANTDGVVVLYSSIGSIDLHFGQNEGDSPSAYDNGRTLTHEVGHYLGLRHIWGDGGCGASDFCDDTPDSDNPNYGCPNTSSCGTTDMVENYMDYTDDDCMDIFTADQNDRMQTVMMVSPRRAELNSSTVADGPWVSFESASSSEPEGSDCDTRIASIPIQISYAGTSETTVNIQVNPMGTSADASDYQLLTTSLSFAAEDDTDKLILLEITRDTESESNETIELEFSSISGDGNLPCNLPQSFTYTIEDDDSVGQNPDYDYINEDFNGDISSWTITDGGSTTDTWDNVTDYNGNSLNGSIFMMADSDAPGNGSTMNEVLSSPVFDASTATTLSLDFDQYIRVYSGANDYNETFDVEVFDGSTWQNVFAHTEADGNLGSWATPNHQTIDISAYANANMQIRFTYAAEWDYYWSIDNVVVNGDISLEEEVQTEVNTISGFAEVPIGPFETVHFYDTNTGNIMATVENLGNFDYGCTRVEVESAGTSSYLSDASGIIDVTSKNFLITPEFNDPSGSYNLTLYYTQAEIDGWIADNTQGSELEDLRMVKSAGIVSTAEEVEILNAVSGPWRGTDYSFEALITSGFSGFGLANEATVPLELLSFEAVALGKKIELNWDTENEIDIEGFELHRGNDQLDLEKIAFIPSNQSLVESKSYGFIDRNVLTNTPYYYRLKSVDLNGSYTFSEFRYAILKSQSNGITISPNPAKDEVNIELTNNVDQVQIEIRDLQGKSIYLNKFTNTSLINLDVSEFKEGIYLISLLFDGNQLETKRIVVL